MKITVIDIVPGCIGLIRIPEQNGAPQDGTITGRLTGADAFNGLDGGFVVLPHGAEITPENGLGFGMLLIVGGAAEGVVKESGDAVDPIIFPGGQLCDVYAYIDLGGDDFPTKGDWWAGPLVTQVDGDTIIDFTYPGDFTELAAGFPFTWQLYGTWTNEEYNGWVDGPAAKIVVLESDVVELYTNVWDSAPFETQTFTITGDWTDPEVHWFQATTAEGTMYILFGLFDGGNTLAELISGAGYPDSADLDPSSGKYDVIFYRQD